MDITTDKKSRKLSIMPLEKRLMFDASLPVIAGQVLWLDANDATTVLDAEGDNAASGGAFSGTATTWRDKSASNFHVTATAGQAPVYTTNALNGHSVLTFDGTNDKLTRAAASIPGDDHTMFIVFNKTQVANRDAVFEFGGGGARNGLFVGDASAPNRMNYYINGTFVNYTSNYTVGAYTMSSVVHNGTSVNLFRNGTSEVNVTSLNRTGTNGLYVGDDSSGTDNLQGNIAEILVYDRDLSADERHDIENYLANKWGVTTANAAPTVSANTGTTMDQGDSAVLTTAMLSATDTDNTDSTLRYTITDAVDYGTLTNTNTGLTLGLGDRFTQGDIVAGYITYAHNNSANFSESFSFTVNDGLATTAAASFSITLTPTNTAPVIDGWTLVSYEDFEAGATGWANNNVENGGTYLTRHLGRFSNNGAGQTNFKTYALSGDQDYTVIEFDFYRMDSWDTEAFRIYVDDALIFNQNFTTAVAVIPDGSSGSVSWNVTETTTAAVNFAYGSWTDQRMRFTLTIDNDTAGTVKLGFGSGVQQGVADESWGIDNVRVYEADGGNAAGPYTIAENSANGQTVGRVTARDPEGNGITYSITGGTGAAAFSINASTGLITVSNSALLNYEVTPSFTLQITATDNGTPILTDVEMITIGIIDVPENTTPNFPAAGPFAVAENAANNTVVGTASATDPDGHTLTYSITGGNTDNIFAINATTGAIRIANNTNLNYEWDNQYTLTITATDNGFGALTANRNVVINITDVNEAPIFDAAQAVLANNPYLRYDNATGNFYQYVGTASTYAAASAAATAQTIYGVTGHLATITSLTENNYVRALGAGNIWLGATDVALEGDWVWGAGGAEGGQMFWQGVAAGSAQNGLYARWSAGEPNNSGNADYAIMLASGLWDDVASGSYAYVIEWEGSSVLAATAALQNGPYAVNENVAAGTAVGAAEAYDPDTANTISYSITGGTGSSLFSIDSATGAITVTASGTLNYEAATSYTIDVRAQDVGGLFATRTITVNIADVNETPVIAALGTLAVAENAANNTLLATASATDPDSNTITYSIVSGNNDNIFSINGGNGQIRVTNNTNMSFEHDGQYVLTVRATDNGTGSLYAETTLTINVTDVNEAPTFDAIQALLLSDPLLRYDTGTGNFYKYYGTAQNYATASTNASTETLNGVGGHIATVTTLAENTFIRNMGGGTLWLSGRDDIVEGDWYWDGGGTENGVVFWQGTSGGSTQNGLFARWGGGEPNNSSNEDHLTLRTDGFWNDISGGSFAYVVEWEGADVLAAAAALQNGPYTINENSIAGASVGSAEAFDIDAADTISYSITGGTGSSLFSINSSTGAITVTTGNTLNYEATNSYTLDLRVQDTSGLFSTRTVTININDINDLPTNMNLSGNNIVENNPVGTLIGNLSAFDEDGHALSYTLVNDSSGHFRLVGTTIETNRAIDYEQFASHTLTIRMNDGNDGVVDQNFVVNVTNLADDAFVPPPSPSNPDPVAQNYALETPEEYEKGDILASALQGDGGLEGAYYGMGAFTQILRENTVFEIRDMLESGTGQPGDIMTDLPGFVTELYQLIDDESDVDDATADRAAHFTNLREVLAFLEQLDNDKTEQGAEKNADGANNRVLPRTPLDAQFEDVMTYHEKRRAALREALLS